MNKTITAAEIVNAAKEIWLESFAKEVADMQEMQIKGQTYNLEYYKPFFIAAAKRAAKAS